MFKAIVNNKRNYIFMLAVMAILMFLFYRSFYWDYQGVSVRKIIEGVIIVFFIVVIPVLCVWIKSLNNAINSFFASLNKAVDYIKSNPKKSLTYIVIFIAIGPIIYLIFGAFIENKYIIYTIISACYLAYFIVAFRKIAAKKVEVLFFFVMMTLGIFQISVTPAVPGISTDDEIHYERTLTLSNVFNGFFYEAELEAINGYTYVILDKSAYDEETRLKTYDELNSLYETKTNEAHHFGNHGVWSISYIPSAVGIIIGKGLSLSFVHTYMLGKIFNLLMYAIVMYFAIKNLKYGKILFAVLGLIPSMVFLAANYSYDAWLFAFVALGFSLFIRVLQTDEKFKTRNIIWMDIFFFIGFLPKAVYVFMLIPLIFVPKKKFTSKKQRAFYYIFTIIVVLIVVATFILPMISNADAQQDIRGGEGVNSTAQIQYIVSNPLQYLKTLGGFLNSYLALGNFKQVIQWFAYLGTGHFYVLSLITIVVVAILDRGARARRFLAIRISSVFSYIFTIALVATALYISFTAVGAKTVAGCQSRYIIPLLLPLLYFIFPDGLQTNINKNKLAIISIAIMSFTFMYNIVDLSVRLY